MRKGRKRFEVSTHGIDSGLQGLSSDPLSVAFPSSTGLLVPAFVNTPATRYRFLLASYVARSPSRLLGMRQGLWIVGNGGGEGGTTPIELLIRDPNFRYPDANVSWHLVREPNQVTAQPQVPTTDAPSFRFMESEQAALLYQTVAYAPGTFNPLTGQPFFYNLGMTAYTPPPSPNEWQGIAGLGTFYDTRFPWDSHNAWQSLSWAGVEVEAGERVSLYATVLQTDPSSREPFGIPAGTLPFPSAMPEPVAFDADFSGQTRYGRVAGALIVEVDMPDDWEDE